MKLYLLRHAPAVDRTEWKKSEAERPLSEEGREKMKENAAGLAQLDLDVHAILTSPYRRAYDTALIASKALKAQKLLRLSKALTPDGDPKGLMRHLASGLKAWENIMLVGHDPYLSQLLGVLVNAPGLRVDFKKGGLAVLQVDKPAFGPCARLLAFYPPKTLRNLH